MLKFDLLTCLIVFYDCLMVPFKNTFGSEAFGEKTALILNIIDYSIKLIFAIDIVFCFRRSYLHERSGHEIRDPKKIAWRYLKFYFWIDLISAIPFDLIVENSFLRLVSLVKVFRLFRLKRIVSFLNIDISTRAKIRILYLAIELIIAIHWAACYFYSITLVGWERAMIEHEEFHEGAYVDLWGNHRIFFEFNYWVPPVDLA